MTDLEVLTIVAAVVGSTLVVCLVVRLAGEFIAGHTIAAIRTLRTRRRKPRS